MSYNIYSVKNSRQIPLGKCIKHKKTSLDIETAEYIF